MSANSDIDRRICIGVSACLLGRNVRYDGGHKHDCYVTGTLGRHFRWVPVCPEVEIGLPTPRPSLRLERHGGSFRIVMHGDGREFTGLMRIYARHRVAELVENELSGYILKKNSPSCGMDRVRVYNSEGNFVRDGRGIFARVLMERLPDLPVEEEGRLRDPALCENWLTRVFAYRRLRLFWQTPWSIGDLMRFHTRHKFLLLAHSPGGYREMGQLVSDVKMRNRGELQDLYQSSFMASLSKIATRAKHTNILQHIMGFFKNNLDAAAKCELCDCIMDYHRGLVPLSVPLALVKHYVRIFDVEYLRDQFYLDPHPKELALRNHIEKLEVPTGRDFVKYEDEDVQYCGQY